MSCKISLNINKGKYSDMVSVIGAVNTVNVSNIVTDIKSLKTNIVVPKTIAEEIGRASCRERV